MKPLNWHCATHGIIDKKGSHNRFIPFKLFAALVAVFRDPKSISAMNLHILKMFTLISVLILFNGVVAAPIPTEGFVSFYCFIRLLTSEFYWHNKDSVLTAITTSRTCLNTLVTNMEYLFKVTPCVSVIVA